MGDVTHCDQAIVQQARGIWRDRSASWRVRAWALAIQLVFQARMALGFSRRGRSRLRFRAYGRWCGPGYGEGDPVDELDCACRDHDHCYSAVWGPR